MITFIRTWQITLKRLEIAQFEFNAYIISVLVIFFLQMNYDFPTIEKTVVRSTVSNFKSALKGFFNFYGNQYDIPNHVISTQIGRWQQRYVQPDEILFDPAQKQFVLVFLQQHLSRKILKNET